MATNNNTYEDMLERLRRERGNAGAPEGVVNTPPEIGIAPAPNGYKAVPLYDTETGREISPDNPTGVPAEVETVPEQKANGYYQIPVGEEPKKPERYGDYNWFGDFVGQYMNPLTNEDRARRERAAYITSGVQNLGKAFGALGNMFAARNGAPAQQPINVDDADKRVNAFREYADRERNAYLSAKLQRQKLLDDAYDKEWARWKGAEDLNYRMAKTQEELALRRMEYDRRRAKDVLLAQAQEAEIEGKKELANLRRTQAERYQALTEADVKRILSQANLNNTRAAYIGATEDTDYEFLQNPDGTLRLDMNGRPIRVGQNKKKVLRQGGSNGGGKKQLPQGGGKKKLP